MKKSCMFHFDL